MMTRRSWAVMVMLGAIWAMLIAWQAAEHVRARHGFQNMVVDRGRYVSTTCGVLMRSRSFFSVISRERLESALNELVAQNTNELHAIQLLNTNGEAVASAGISFEMPPRNELEGGVYWGEDNVIMVNPVDLGTNVPQLVLPREELRSLETNNAVAAGRANTNNLTESTTGTNSNFPRRRLYDWRRQGKPYWMSEDAYHSLLEKKGAHTFVVVMSNEFVRRATENDLWMRSIIAFLGTIAVAGCAAAWRNLEKTSELQLRLVRASELNLHLKELNLAAAGLAHETRNPLNIIRGLAHLISKQQTASAEVQAKSREIINETDRVTAQLNEFINYSRPREVRRAPTDLAAVAAEVARTLTYDIDEKKIQLQLQIEPLTIEADEQLLRQALFNLVLNAIQAVPNEGTIRIRASNRTNDQAFIEISDNGPGVAPEHRAEIFKPYFTTHEEGTGLGLAVVQQIVLAHGWEIECMANEPSGALFRISHVAVKHKD